MFLLTFSRLSFLVRCLSVLRVPNVFVFSPVDHLGVCGTAGPRLYSFSMEGMPGPYGGQPSLGFAVSIGIRVPGRDGSRQVSGTQSQYTY